MKSLKRKHLKAMTILLLLVSVVGIVIFAIYKSPHPLAMSLKRQAIRSLESSRLQSPGKQIQLPEFVDSLEVYVNNVLVDNENPNMNNDVRKVYRTHEDSRLINYADGFTVDLPADTQFDFSYGKVITKAKTQSMDIVLSTEWSPYDNVDEYIAYYLNRFILSEEYQKANDIDVTRSFENNVENITAVLNGAPNYDTYSYITIRTGTRRFYRMMFKYHQDDPTATEIIENAISSFVFFKPSERGRSVVDFRPILPFNLTKETTQLYDSIANENKLRWGIFARNVYDEGIDVTIPEIERKIDFKFDVTLSYIHFKTEFPLEFMQKNHELGKIVELTYQITDSNNEDLFGYTPNLDIYRGKYDDEIRKFARAAKQFGHPFLFRLNNEMNSDWTSYSGVINMSDPEIYIENWRRFYRIFHEEGADNVLWIFNPNDRNYPPCNFNSFINYYPGNEYVHLLGVTGYNNGTYYKDVTGEEWREFDAIYNEIYERYKGIFDEFPWIITEFASSSVGGNKVKWINNMFTALKKYPQIKIAVWFSYADYDFRPGYEGKVARPYWLDETPETLEAFGRGIKKHYSP